MYFGFSLIIISHHDEPAMFGGTCVLYTQKLWEKKNGLEPRSVDF